ncbi:MAG TPA: hypothetical protein VKB80_28330 [Kofleriaceae bacterium]|nr:hypothetical protein [Kofleriaceae bacterium]
MTRRAVERNRPAARVVSPVSARARAPGRARAGAFVVAFALVVIAALPGRARAGGLDFDLLGGRSIAHAGATTVSVDGGAALVGNPAGLARTSSLRVQLGVALHDDDASFRAPDAAAMNSPTVADRSEPVLAPSGAFQGALGPVVLGAAVLELGHLERLLPAPSFNQTDEDVVQLYPHRYGGLELGYRRRAAVAGAAMRIGEWLGVGISLGASDVELDERRRMWAGFADRDQLTSPARDLDLSLHARDRLVPFAGAGVLVAPPSLPIEVGAAVSWSADADLDGDVALDDTADHPFPEPISNGEPPGASLRLGMPTVLRAGARYVGDRLLVEVGADLTRYRSSGKLPVWHTTGAAVRDDTGVTADVGDVPSLVALRDHSALRGAVDVEIVPGLLWLTAGYAHASGATARSRLSPAFGDLAGHTVSLGAEATWNQITIDVGLARRLSPSVDVAAGDSHVEMQNPFDAGTADAGAGRHGRAHDAVGLTMEVAWE